MGTPEDVEKEEGQVAATTEIKVDPAPESIEEIQTAVLQIIQPRLGEVFRRLGKEAFPSINDEEECIEDEHAKYFMQLCFESDEALDELKNILLELEMTDAYNSLDQVHVPKLPEDEPPEVVTQEKEEVKPVPYREVLQESFGTMVDCLKITNRMLNLLQELSVLNAEMISKIQCRPNRPTSVRTLLNFLLELGPKSLHGFIFALRETDQKFLANILAVHTFA